MFSHLFSRIHLKPGGTIEFPFVLSASLLTIIHGIFSSDAPSLLSLSSRSFSANKYQFAILIPDLIKCRPVGSRVDFYRRSTSSEFFTNISTTFERPTEAIINFIFILSSLRFISHHFSFTLGFLRVFIITEFCYADRE